jgi:hypothetical protein
MIEFGKWLQIVGLILCGLALIARSASAQKTDSTRNSS